MSRPPQTPRLADLDPATVADDALRLVRAHVERLSFYAGYGTGSAVDLPGGSLRLEMAVLCHYAQTGELPAEYGGTPVGALQTVCECLYSQAGVPHTYGAGDFDAEEIDGAELDAIGLVLVGTRARMLLEERGSALSARQLAVLAGLDDSHVRRLARAGELALEGGGVPRAEARRWLSGRGVPGVR